MAGEHNEDVRASRPFPDVLDVDRWLLDRQLLDVDGIAVGKIDDLEFSDPVGDEPPALTNLLCGPAALGPRIGGRLGVWWTALGLRLRARLDTDPVRIPVGVVAGVQPAGVQLLAHGAVVGTWLAGDWAREKIVQRIPGSRR